MHCFLFTKYLNFKIEQDLKCKNVLTKLKTLLSHNFTVLL